MKTVNAYTALLIPIACCVALSSATAAPPPILNQQSTLPQVIQGEEGRVLMAAGDKLYAESLGHPSTNRYYLLRPGPVLNNAGTAEGTARGSIYLGKATLVRRGNPAVLRVEQARREIRPGDYLMPMTRSSDDQDG